MSQSPVPAYRGFSFWYCAFLFLQPIFSGHLTPGRGAQRGNS